MLLLLQSTPEVSALPGFVREISGMLLDLLPVAALVCIVLAGLRLRGEGGINFDHGGGFVKWLLWSALLLTLPTIFLHTAGDLFNGPHPIPIHGNGSAPAFHDIATSLTGGFSTFVATIVIGRFIPILAAALCFKAILDSAEGHSPLPSIISAMFLLGSAALWGMMQGNTWNPNGEMSPVTLSFSRGSFAAADILGNMLNYLANSISPYVAVLCFCGAAMNFWRSKGWGQLFFTGVAFMSFTGLWKLVTTFMGVGNLQW